MALAPDRTGIGIRRHYTTEGVHPYEQVEWERRDARITNYRDGAVAFEQPDVELPRGWSQNATNIVAQKYFRGHLGAIDREWSLKQMVDRVVDTITEWGIQGGYFADDSEAEAFRAELKFAVITQRASFNSPVWFNIGVNGRPAQGSACFILAVDDTMDSILNWYVEEGTIFKGGSGSGINLSKIRSSYESLSGGGTASGPVSFMRGADASAGTIKSGGTTRRAAKMVILNSDHPDIEDFIWCKALEERKARALRDAGFDMDLDGSDGHSIQYQNANNSVRVTDEFMQAVLDDADWQLRAVKTGETVGTIRARELFRQMAEAAWECADPGMQFDTTINRWNTAANTGRINASNPCCFVGETLVVTTAGLRRIDQLHRMSHDGKQLPDAVAFDLEVREAVPREVIKAWVAGYASSLVEVRTASGSVLRCTPEHRFLTVADEYVEAQNLMLGDELRGATVNDKVLSVERFELDEPVAVYDLHIEGTHNFAVAGSPDVAAVIVHNSEYMHLDNSACNLASINLLKFLDEEAGRFDVEGFQHTIEVVFTAQEILVGRADYPTDKIAETSRRFRQLGLGFANLGALLMALGLPYDSDEGRAWASALTALMTGHAYSTSARTAARMGPFAGYVENREPMLNVLRMHRGEVAKVDEELLPTELLGAAQKSWDETVELAEAYGVRNSQATVIAPTGTIGLMLDCDTTGIEPDLGLVKVKKLVGGGTMQFVNQTVPRALRRLGYTQEQIEEIVAYVDENKSILGAPHLVAEHVAVFACSMGDNPIHYMGHIRMMAAVQPWISGAISKCVTGETLLNTADGLVRIGSLYRGEMPDSFRDEIVGVASLGGTEKTDAFYYGGVKPVREVVLRSGHRVTGTPNHRLLVGTKRGLAWKRLDEIEEGDLVAVKYGAELWSSLPARFDDFSPSASYGCQKSVRIPGEVTDELALLLGAYAAEGHTTRSNWTVHITNSVPDVRERLVKAWRDLFGVQAVIVQSGDRCPQVVVASKTIVEFLEYLGCGARASEKRIPDAVLRSPRSMVLAFVQGLALDAYTTVATAPKWGICLDSPGLLEDLQSVLTNLGVVHGRVEKWNKDYEKFYGEVYAAGTEAQRLVQLVPFLEPDKAARADELLARSFETGRNTADIIPMEPMALYRHLPPYLSRQDEPVRSKLAFLCDRRTKHVTRDTVERVADILGVVLPPWVHQVLEDNMHFSPVVGTADAGLREVFDVSVPTTQAFVGNGIVNHNTVNTPEEATVEEIEQLFIESWQLGLKAVAVYRDNCKVGQPLAMAKKETKPIDSGVTEVAPERPVETVVVREPQREKLPRDRSSRTFDFRVADCKGFVTVAEYADGRPGEIFIRISKMGSTLAGIVDSFAISVSYGLQYGVPLRAYVETFTNTRFEPAGMTDDPEIRFASSILDFIFRKLAVIYLTIEEREELNILTIGERMQPTLPGVEESVVETNTGHDIQPDPPSVPSVLSLLDDQGNVRPGSAVDPSLEARHSDAPFCTTCGVQMVRAGSCHACPSCGTTSGCS